MPQAWPLGSKMSNAPCFSVMCAPLKNLLRELCLVLSIPLGGS